MYSHWIRDSHHVNSILVQKKVDKENTVEEEEISQPTKRKYVFNETFNAKAAEIFCKHRDMFENLEIMFGGFHLLMMLLGVMGIRFSDAGLKEITIQSEAVAERSIEKVLEEENYNRAV